MNTLRLVLFLVVTFVSFKLNAQTTKSINIMFYNVENLFDTIDNPQTFDEDFTPSGKLEYNSLRYSEKVKNLAKVVDSSFSDQAPDVIGLCEVENVQVVEALRKKINVTKSLGVVHIDSPDGRGIDNALLYDTALFKLQVFGLKSIDLGKDERPTRGILWVVLKANNIDQPLIFLVNHWPSRYGGTEESEWKRMRASETSIVLIDSLKGVYPRSGLVFMGDLNDHPDNRSVEMLESCIDTGPCLMNMHKKFVGEDAGSHAYRGVWGVLDQILVNQNLITGDAGLTINSESAGFVNKPWMLYYSEKDQDSFPSRSYGGKKYFGGFSDHLPATLRLTAP